MDREPIVNTQNARMLERLRKEKLKMSHRRFAHETGIAKSSIQRWEKQGTDAYLSLPQIKSLLRLMQQAGLDPVEDFPEN